MGEWFAGRMWNEHPALHDFGNWAPPLALGVAFGAANWGVVSGWFRPGLWPASLRVAQDLSKCRGEHLDVCSAHQPAAPDFAFKWTDNCAVEVRYVFKHQPTWSTGPGWVFAPISPATSN